MINYKEAYNKAFNLGCLYDSEEQKEGRDLLYKLVNQKNDIKQAYKRLKRITYAEYTNVQTSIVYNNGKLQYDLDLLYNKLGDDE